MSQPETVSRHPDPRDTAKAAHLRYVSDTKPGITRIKQGKKFYYALPNGARIMDKATLDRINSLAIPPAYADVWICALENGHLQATGRDEKGRKQYRYHPRWRAVRDETKYDRMIAFGDALPRIRARVLEDLSRAGLGREKVLAAIVRLLETTRIRVGSEEYAQTNQSYGLTTLRNDHVDVTGTQISFHFRGKSGKNHEIDIRDARVARVVKKCLDLPGQDLFEYVADDKTLHTVHSDDVNAYLRDASGDDFTAKDFRTWAGTVLCAFALRTFEEYESTTEAQHNIVEAVKNVSQRLGNTPAICRKCYIHPTVLDSYLDGSLLRDLTLASDMEPTQGDGPALTKNEAAVLNFLQKRTPSPK